jgi:hypothetical protein
MTVTISAPVGYHGRNGGNRAPDVRVVHDLLSRIPPSKGGAGARLNPNAGYSAQTDEYIYTFQKFHKLGVADATVHPGHQTLVLLNELAKGGVTPAPRPGQPAIPTPVPQPGPGPDIAPLPLLAVMTSTIVGHGYISGFDNKAKQKKGRFRVPLYRLRLGRADTSDGEWKLSTPVMDFDVVRFGVAYDDVAFKEDPRYSLFRIQGPPVGEFVLSRANYLKGSWQFKLKPHYYVHDGPDNPHFMSSDIGSPLFGALGCIEICWPGRMKLFDEATRRLAFGNFDEIGFYSPEEADARITKAESFRCVVEAALKPPLLPLTDFRDIGGPAPIRG